MLQITLSSKKKKSSFQPLHIVPPFLITTLPLLGFPKRNYRARLGGTGLYSRLLGRLRQEDRKLKAHCDYIESSRPAPGNLVRKPREMGKCLPCKSDNMRPTPRSHGGRGGLVAESCPLTSTMALWHASATLSNTLIMDERRNKGLECIPERALA